MKAFLKGGPAAAIIFLLASCAGVVPTVAPPDPALTDANAATLILYHPEINYSRAARVYPDPPFVGVDGQTIGRLPYGRSLTRLVAPGRHRLALREAFLGMFGKDIAAIDMTLAAGRTYFLRFSNDRAGLSPAPDVPATGGSPELMFVDAATWLSQR